LSKITYHPKAFLLSKRNVPKGLVNRTKVIYALERKPSDAKSISEETGMSYSSVLHHLRLLENERIVARKGKKPYIWELTGAGQQSLMEKWIAPSRSNLKVEAEASLEGT